MRFAAYTGTSIVLATGVILSALHQRSNFYSACVYLAQSNACVMILANVAFLSISMIMLGLQKFFYGALRPIEVEQLYEKAWFAVTETCLAMTIFREEVGGWFLVMFVGLLIGKVWGWVGEGRVEVLEQQPPVNPHLFHVRLSTSLAISTLFDATMLSYCVRTVLQHARPNMMVMFAFEFAVLFVTSMSTTFRYLISVREAWIIKVQTKERKRELKRQEERDQATVSTSRDAKIVDQKLAVTKSTAAESDMDSMDVDVPGWEEKGRWIFYLDLATDFCKLVLYMAFFCVLCMFYGMPIHIIRDVALTIRSFHKRITDFLRYRQATRDMNTRYPDATPEEVKREDCCIICRESMKAWSLQSNLEATSESDATGSARKVLLSQRARPKKLPCGHVLHFACLRSWLERQQNCPTCRAPVLVPNPTIQAQPEQVPDQGMRAPPGPDLPRNPIPGPFNGQPAVPAQNVYQFGPLRIAFGARNGIQGLQPQVNHPQPNLAIAGGNAAPPNNSIGHMRQPRLVETRPHANTDPLNLSMQLQQIEQQLLREMSNLRLQADQLYIIRALQNELSRLRLLQAHSNVLPATSNTQSQNRPTASFLNTGQPSQHGPIFTSSPAHQSMGSSHTILPPGLSLPEGWSILPLQRMSNVSDPSHVAGPSILHPFRQGSAPVSSQLPQAGPSNDPEHVVSSIETSSDTRKGQSTAGGVSGKPSHVGKPSTEPQLPRWGPTSPETAATANVTVRSESDAAEADQTPDRQYISEQHSTFQHESQSKGKGRASTVEDAPSDVD